LFLCSFSERCSMIKKLFPFIYLVCQLFTTPAFAENAFLITGDDNTGTVPFINAGRSSGTTAATALGFQVNEKEYMRITATGSVGIGTTTPAAKMDVNGGIHPGAATTGASCSDTAEGSFAYDMSVHTPVYCNSSRVWASMGSGDITSITPHDVKSTRTSNTSYHNTTGGLMFVSVSIQSSNNVVNFSALVGPTNNPNPNIVVSQYYSSTSNIGVGTTLFLVPRDYYYYISTTGTINYWVEYY